LRTARLAILPFALFLLSIASCSPNNVKVDNSIKTFFEENKSSGSFAILNNATNEFTIYNLKQYRDSNYSPGSSFDILTSLIGLQTGAISNDSVKLNVADRQISLPQAFRSSFDPYFQQIARTIGKDTMQFWIDSIFAHSKKITTPDHFWLDNSLKLVADQQLGLVRKLYFKQLPFFQSYQLMVQNAMMIDDNSNYKLAYKFGPGRKENGDPICWMPGWIEENRHPYFFVLFFEPHDKTADLKATGEKMLKDILKQQGFLQGRM